MLNIEHKLGCALAIFALSGGIALAAEADLQKQIDEVKSALPKFAIPMREVGDRFQNIYFAAKDGNWALAAYMSKYMNGSMNPASVTKPAEYKVWKGFYDNTFASVNKAIMAKDWKALTARTRPSSTIAMAATRHGLRVHQGREDVDACRQRNRLQDDQVRTGRRAQVGSSQFEYKAGISWPFCFAARLVAEREARDCTGARGPPFHGFLWPVMNITPTASGPIPAINWARKPPSNKWTLTARPRREIN